MFGPIFESVRQYCKGIILYLEICMYGIESLVGALQHQSNHLLCCGWHAFITNTDKCHSLPVSYVVIGV